MSTQTEGRFTFYHVVLYAFVYTGHKLCKLLGKFSKGLVQLWSFSPAIRKVLLLILVILGFQNYTKQHQWPYVREKEGGCCLWHTFDLLFGFLLPQIFSHSQISHDVMQRKAANMTKFLNVTGYIDENIHLHFISMNSSPHVADVQKYYKKYNPDCKEIGIVLK